MKPKSPMFTARMGTPRSATIRAQASSVPSPPRDTARSTPSSRLRSAGLEKSTATVSPPRERTNASIERATLPTSSLRELMTSKTLRISRRLPAMSAQL